MRKGYEEVTTYSMLHLGAGAGRAGICRQGGAGREDMSKGWRRVRKAALAAREHPALPSTLMCSPDLKLLQVTAGGWQFLSSERVIY